MMAARRSVEIRPLVICFDLSCILHDSAYTSHTHTGSGVIEEGIQNGAKGLAVANLKTGSRCVQVDVPVEPVMMAPTKVLMLITIFRREIRTNFFRNWYGLHDI